MKIWPHGVLVAVALVAIGGLLVMTLGIHIAPMGTR
jgi:hypothetical protein